MKKHLFLAGAAMICAMTFTACSSNDNPVIPADEGPNFTVLTFEDADWTGGANYLGEESWTSLIDTPQYGGPLLYPTAANATLYRWADGKTHLAHVTTAESTGMDANGMKEFYYGGIAISNYVDADLANGTYMAQLAVPTNGGNNGSKNFAVAFDGSSFMGEGPVIYFDDEVERVIDHMYVAPTTYVMNSIVNGDGFADPLTTNSGSLWIKATGYDADGNETASTEFYLCKEGQYISTWTKFDLSVLGKVCSVEFTMDGTDKGQWGLNTPAYFAFDDVAVVME